MHEMGGGSASDLVQGFTENLPGDVGAESWRQKWSCKSVDRCHGQPGERSLGRRNPSLFQGWKETGVARPQGERGPDKAEEDLSPGPLVSAVYHSRHSPILAHPRLPATLSQSLSYRWENVTQSKEVNFAHGCTASKWRIQTQAP